MRYLVSLRSCKPWLLATTTILVIAGCRSQKVNVEDSEHDVNVRFGDCDVFEGEEKLNCVRTMLKALEGTLPARSTRSDEGCDK